MEDDIITKEQYAPCVSVFVRASQLNIGRELAVLVGARGPAFFAMGPRF